MTAYLKCRGLSGDITHGRYTGFMQLDNATFNVQQPPVSFEEQQEAVDPMKKQQLIITKSSGAVCCHLLNFIHEKKTIPIVGIYCAHARPDSELVDEAYYRFYNVTLADYSTVLSSMDSSVSQTQLRFNFDDMHMEFWPIHEAFYHHRHNDNTPDLFNQFDLENAIWSGSRYRLDENRDPRYSGLQLYEHREPYREPFNGRHPTAKAW